MVLSKILMDKFMYENYIREEIVYRFMKGKLKIKLNCLLVGFFL